MGTMSGLYGIFKVRDRSVLLLSIAALVPLLAVMALSIFQYAANRYVFVSLTSWIILASLAFHELRASIKGDPRIFLVGILLVMVLEPLSEDFLYHQYQSGNRDNWKAAFELIEDNIWPEDRVVVTEPLLGDYYMAAETVGIGSLDIDALSTSEGRVWFVEDNNLANKFPKKMRWIEKNAQLISNFDVTVRARLFKMRVYLYDP
jgi:hypothetical protein